MSHAKKPTSPPGPLSIAMERGSGHLFIGQDVATNPVSFRVFSGDLIGRPYKA